MSGLALSRTPEHLFGTPEHPLAPLSTPICRTLCGMEFLTFVIIFGSAWLLWRRPEKERLAARLLIAAVVLMFFLFTLGTRGSLLPGLNY
jgi:polyferredoxin